MGDAREEKPALSVVSSAGFLDPTFFKNPQKNARSLLQSPPCAKQGHVPNLFWRRISKEDLNGHPLFKPLEPPSTLSSPSDLSLFPQDSWQWDALHLGRVTSARLAPALGFFEPHAAARLDIPYGFRSSTAAQHVADSFRDPSQWAVVTGGGVSPPSASSWVEYLRAAGSAGQEGGGTETKGADGGAWRGQWGDDERHPFHACSFIRSPSSDTGLNAVSSDGSLPSSGSAVESGYSNMSAREVATLRQYAAAGEGAIRMSWGSAQESSAVLSVLNFCSLFGGRLEEAGMLLRAEPEVEGIPQEILQRAQEVLQGRSRRNGKGGRITRAITALERLQLNSSKGQQGGSAAASSSGQAEDLRVPSFPLPPMGGSPDALVRWPCGALEVVEVKNHSPFCAAKNRDCHVDGAFRTYANGPFGGLLPQYWTQMQIQMLSAGESCRSGLFCSQSAVGGSVLLRVHRSDEWLGRALVFLSAFFSAYCVHKEVQASDRSGGGGGRGRGRGGRGRGRGGRGRGGAGGLHSFRPPPPVEPDFLWNSEEYRDFLDLTRRLCSPEGDHVKVVCLVQPGAVQRGPPLGLSGRLFIDKPDSLWPPHPPARSAPARLLSGSAGKEGKGKEHNEEDSEGDPTETNLLPSSASHVNADIHRGKGNDTGDGEARAESELPVPAAVFVFAGSPSTSTRTEETEFNGHQSGRGQGSFCVLPGQAASSQAGLQNLRDEESPPTPSPSVPHIHTPANVSVPSDSASMGVWRKKVNHEDPHDHAGGRGRQAGHVEVSSPSTSQDPGQRLQSRSGGLRFVELPPASVSLSVTSANGDRVPVFSDISASEHLSIRGATLSKGVSRSREPGDSSSPATGGGKPPNLDADPLPLGWRLPRQPVVWLVSPQEAQTGGERP
uniref:Uncharacterized protein n=1 Tax=Chromera velia CCMP2878 TaxID=1169474 RepID=A0A0G4HES6_9ALVE|eukprot:Cvel_6583.t1-p1 / transcript=Cvel_6583.t1 / gene=Cvel_6583 / organism=Chromera_velia_CCMP2878 / gene_product=hypothetical protein / transcript_product=hypothetical protein / location=Cvel_scaffold324:95040-99175(-) / protein_length=891 / sequence_SO=supercontig / SO=protein_coding / is_pseudo=false